MNQNNNKAQQSHAAFRARTGHTCTTQETEIEKLKEEIKALKDDLKELIRTILDVSDYAGIVLAEELKKKYKLGE